ncbi:MAG TPA: tetratricopeptide repeat protein, partial [bacterium]|nr:tetratricopeptide repeat protein [bacterium]
MRMKPTWLHFLPLLCALLGQPAPVAARSAPGRDPDSLRQPIESRVSHPSRLSARVNQAWALVDSSPDSARQLLENALQLSRQTQESAREVEILNDLGLLHGRLGNFLEAQQYLDQAMAMARGQHNFRELARAQNNQGNLAFQQQDFPRAIRMFEQARALLAREQSRIDPRQEMLATTLAPLASAYLEVTRLPEAARAF